MQPSVTHHAHGVLGAPLKVSSSESSFSSNPLSKKKSHNSNRLANKGHRSEISDDEMQSTPPLDDCASHPNGKKNIDLGLCCLRGIGELELKVITFIDRLFQ